MFSNYKYLFKCNKVYLLILVFFFLNNLNMGIFLNYLEEYIKLYDVIIEDAKGYIDIYYIENNKEKKLKSYPIELILVYNIDAYNKKIILLNEILKNQFRLCTIELKPLDCQLWSTDFWGYNSGFLRGESFNGSYKQIHFKFAYFIQDADGYNLVNMDKLWPLLNNIINENKIDKKNYFYNNILKAKLSIDLNTLKIRKGRITQSTNMYEILINYYNENYKLKPTVFLMNRKYNRYQLIIIDLPINSYYSDVFKKKNINLEYLNKLYKIEKIEKMRFIKEYWIKIINIFYK